MINYKKGKNVEEELTKDNIPIENLPKHFLWMHVKGGTKVSNVIDYAKDAINKCEHRSMVWSGTAGGVNKTISCAEIMKRYYKFYQITRINYRKVEEYWDPLMDGLEPIVVTRKIPCIHIFLSLDEIDDKMPGYQLSQNKTTFWVEHVSRSDNNKHGGNSGGVGHHHRDSKDGYNNNYNNRKNQKKQKSNNKRNANPTNIPTPSSEVNVSAAQPLASTSKMADK